MKEKNKNSNNETIKSDLQGLKLTKEELKEFFDAGFIYRHEGVIDFEMFYKNFTERI